MLFVFQLSVITAWNPQDRNSHLLHGFESAGGKLRVPTSGRYFVYAQLYFNARPADMTPNRVIVKATSRNLFLIHTDLGKSEETTAYGGGVFKFERNEEIYLQVIGYDTKMWIGPAHSFFGAYLIS